MPTIETSQAVAYGLRSTRASTDKWGNWTEATVTHVVDFGQTIPAGARIDSAAATVHVSGQPIVGSYFYMNGESARTTVGDHGFTLSGVTAGTSSFTMAITFKGTGTKNTAAVLNIDRIDFQCTYTPTQSKLQLSSNVFDAGETITATIVPAVNTYSHTITTSFGSRNQAQKVAAGVTSAAVTVPLEWLDQIPNAGSGAGTITLRTMDGGTVIGSDTAEVTIYTPDDAAPIIQHTEEPVYTIDGTTYPDVTGGYVQMRSGVKATATSITGQYGASITKQTITVDKETTTADTLTTGLLQNAGTVNVIYTATDTRGMTVTYTEPITVEKYQVPTIQAFMVDRVDDAGEKSDTGTRAAGEVSFKWSKLNGKNSKATVKIQYKIADGGWTTLQETETEESTLSFTAAGPFAVETKVTFRATVADAYGTIYTAEKEDALEMGWIARWIRRDGQGVAFGQASTKEKGFQIREEWDYYKGESNLLDLAAEKAPVQSVNGQTGAVTIATPTAESKDYGGAYFYHTAGKTTTLSNYTAEASGLYLIIYYIQMVNKLSSRSFVEFGGKRATFDSGTAYPCVVLPVVLQMEAGTTYTLAFYSETGGQLQYEDIKMVKLKLT